jgi:hypothetical protein
MLLYDDELYNQWVDITQGQIEHPSAAIQKDFGAKYILSDLRHKAFLERAAHDPSMLEVYRDEQAVLYEIVSQGGEK